MTDLDNLSGLAKKFKDTYDALQESGKELTEKSIALMRAKDELSSMEFSLLANDEIKGPNAEVRKGVLAKMTFQERLKVLELEIAEKQAKSKFAQAKSKLDELDVYLRIEELKK